MKTLTLPLKKKWFDMIKSGEKKEEYREIKPYYISRFIKFKPLKKDLIVDFYRGGFDDGEIIGMENELVLTSKIFDTLVFTLGYPKADDTERRLVFKNPKIRIGEGNPEWGAEPGKQYFVITWGQHD